MPLLTIELALSLETGLSVGGSGNSGVRADKTILRNGRNQALIPASQVKGRLRHTCETLVRAAGVTICRPPNPTTTCPQLRTVNEPPCLICAIFGSPWTACPLQFRDLVQPQGAENIRPGIGLDRRRRVVKESLLFLQEASDPALGESFYQNPAIQGELPGREEALLILTGLEMLYNWGGGKSRGLGWAEIKVGAKFDGAPLTLDQNGKETLARWLREHTVS